MYEKTLVRRGASVGANSTIVCGTTVGRYAFIAAGAVVTKDVPDYALVIGVPGRVVGWMSRHGYRLGAADNDGVMTDPQTGWKYKLENGLVRCLELGEDEPLPG
jgi:UDP-2-acetamido-3-amino-2,3-dideoxy-glucuronate N-acetyltransferase